MNLLIFLYLFAIAPKMLWERLVLKKRHPDFLKRLGVKLPTIAPNGIWIHAVSVGEIKAAAPLYFALKEKYKDLPFFITTTSETGQNEAKRSLKGADCYSYLPIDLSWVVNRLVRHVRPTLFILVESDFWPNLLKALKKEGTQTVLVSAKISKKSFRRLSFFPFFAKKLLSNFDRIGAQNQEYYDRFCLLVKDPSKLCITGNLKLDCRPKIEKQTIQIPSHLPIITVSCTHDREEEMILNALIDTQAFLIVAPRHPERFSQVAQMLTKKKIPFSLLSENKIVGRVLLIDAMGKLPYFYSISQLVILGGSFVSHIGGHNVLEPCLYQVPVFFGPHMFNQTEFTNLVLQSSAGKKVLESEIKEAVETFLQSPAMQEKMRKGCKELSEKTGGVLKNTLALFS